MERVYSVMDMDGRVCVDCTECARGWNGDQSCSAGWHHDRPRRGGCFCGVPLKSNETALPIGWTELAVTASSAQQREVCIEVGGCRITVTGKTDMELLTRICRALHGIC